MPNTPKDPWLPSSLAEPARQEVSDLLVNKSSVELSRRGFDLRGFPFPRQEHEPLGIASLELAKYEGRAAKRRRRIGRWIAEVGSQHRGQSPQQQLGGIAFEMG